jgi:hypothetical protein
MTEKHTKLYSRYDIDITSYHKGIRRVIKKPQSLFGKKFLNCIYFKIHQKPKMWEWSRCEITIYYEL